MRPRGDHQQRSLFAEPVDKVLAQAQVSRDDLARWKSGGWIGFDATDVVEFEPWQVGTLVFIRDLARSGLSDGQISAMLATMPGQVAWDPARTAWSFRFGWVAPAPEQDPSDVLQDHLDDWLHELGNDGELERLKGLRARIDEIIASRAQSETEDADSE